MAPHEKATPVSTGKIITWSELESHNTGDDCWLVIRGKVYNVTSWVPKHPGGYDTIVLNAGKDATQLFEAYHPLRVHQLLDKYYIGEITYDGDHPVFPPMSQFYIELKKKLENYFAEKKISPRYAPEMVIRTIFLVTAAFVLHYFSVVVPYFPLSVLCAMLLGFSTVLQFLPLTSAACALISFMPVHEGSHASTTESPLVWRLMGSVHDFGMHNTSATHSCTVNGASFYTWLHQHFLGHHPFTNVTTGDPKDDSLDPDVFTNDPDIRRIKPHQPWYSYYAWQPYYVPVLYGLLGIKYRINDLKIVFSLKTNGKIKLNPLPMWHWVMFICGKAFFVFYRIILPCFYIPVWHSLLLFIVSDLLTSYVLAFVFQVNHVVGYAKWPVIDKKTGLVNMDWAEMQLSTTIDYAHDSWWTTFLTGALNYQVTHHLVPYISQIHYPAIAPIIKEHCKAYGLTYHCLPSFGDALKAHLKYLGVMGHEHV